MPDAKKDKKMTYKWTETFISNEGEGPLTGMPTLYVRFANCPFTCRGFNNPDNLELTNEVLGFDPADFTKLSDVPPITMGCDTLYAIDKRFKHLWKTGDADELVSEMMALLPDREWSHPITKQPIALSLTGGEPTLYQKTLPSLLQHPDLEGVEVIIMETNASIPLTEKFITEIAHWMRQRKTRQFIWANSPKTSASGEPRSKAIKPEVINSQLQLRNMAFISYSNVTVYYKFVTDGSLSQINEIYSILDEYKEGGVNGNIIPYLMPESCTGAQQDEIAVRVADACIEHGFVYSYRLQNAIFANAVGK